MEYMGFRVTLDVQFGKMRDKVQIDIGIGDIVEPVEAIFTPFKYKGKPIFSGEIYLNVYPQEVIFSEKLETIISKGIINSRMKDYHDLLIMIREPNFFDINKLANAIQATFNHRKTPTSLPINFDSSGMQSLQILWSKHLHGLGLFRERLNFPNQISDVINEINRWITSNKLQL